MKRLSLGLFGIFAALAVASLSIYRIRPITVQQNTVKEATPEVLGKPSDSTTLSFVKIDYEPNQLTAAVSIPVSAENAIIRSNLEDTQTSVEILTQQSCELLVNAAFYTTENNHGGLFISNYEEIQSFRANQTYNGIFSINSLDTPRITPLVPTDAIRAAIQTGPILIENTREKTIAIANDKYARRMIAAVNGNNEIIFITLYNTSSVFMGPLLSDVPSLITYLNTELNLNIADAINLDGGSASVFTTSGFSLPEASPIGSYFCISDY